MKVNAILDDASNETFLNEEVAGMLGIQEPFQTINVHVLNNEIETFQSMPVNVTIESVDGQFRKSIDVRTCPRKVTGSYKVENWRDSKKSWNHLNECDFPEPAGDRYLDLLIGVDCYSCIFHESTSVGNQGFLLLVWVYLGGPALVHQTVEIRQLPGRTLSEHCSAETLPAVGVVILIKALNVSRRSKRMSPKGAIFEYAQRKSSWR